MMRYIFFRPNQRLVHALMVLAALTTLCLPVKAATVPPINQQQMAQMLSRFYYQTAVEIASRGGLGVSAELMAKVRHLDPNRLEIGLLYAELIQANGDSQKALTVYHELLRQFKEPLAQSILYYRISMVYDGMKDIPNAIDTLQKAIDAHPENVPAGFYYDLGVLYAQLDQYEQTMRYSQKAVEIAPQSAAAWNNLGFSLAKTGKAEQGYDAIQKALALEPDNANARDSMGYVLFQMGRFRESIIEYEKAVTLDPQMAESFLYLGKSYESTHDWGKAIDSYEKFMQVSENASDKTAVEKRLNQLKLDQFLRHESSYRQHAPNTQDELPLKGFELPVQPAVMSDSKQ